MEAQPALGQCHVADMSWDAVGRRLAEGAYAILPVGAGAKQHGWHLPMRTDAIQAEYLSARLAERIPALIWPVLTYGHYPAFVAYDGSCSLSAAVFESVVRELVDGLLGYGATVIILDTGISTIRPIDRAIAGCAGPDRVLHLEVYDGPAYTAAAKRLATQPHGGHADELETSCLLAIAPHVVTVARAAASPVEPPGPGPMQHADPRAPNFSASGSIGDPTLATAAKGEALLAAIIEDMMDAVAAFR